MKISKSKDWTAGGNEIILARRNQEWDGILADETQRTFVSARARAGKDQAVLEQVGRLCLVVFLEEEGPEPNRLEKARVAAFQSLPLMKDLEVSGILLRGEGVSGAEALAFAEGLALSAYQFLKYRTTEQPATLEEIRLHHPGVDEARVQEMDRVVRAVYQSRNLVNEPLSYLTALQLSEEIRAMGKDAGFSVEVFHKKQIESLKMGGLLAVNRGSVDPPTFTVLEWKPEGATNTKPVILVGKGVVYDTGGMSLKPTQDSMDYMKCDMGGAAAVAGAFHALAANRIPLWVIGLIPATDNRTDGNAYVPGDVVRMYNGTTVEVLNTDAEGRMILADALSYADRYEPELIVELSTLTGSAHVAIDKFGLVGMGNAPEEVMAELILRGEECAERIARFPFWDEYKEQLKSDVADLKNIGSRYGGAITAGKFLEHFTKSPYIHLDIAGPAFNKTPFNYRGTGGSGVGVRLLYNFLSQRSRQA